MFPLKLTIRDFCSHKESEINFNDFNCALIVGRINGNDRLSNGAGKTTVFSALKYVLFNETDYSSLDKIIRTNTDACSVSFDFISSDNNSYRIVRSRHKKVGADIRLFRLILNKAEDITARTNSQTEQEIQKIIKINYKTFCNSFFFGQSDLSGLASLRPSERKRSLKSILQLDVYSKYEAFAKKKSNDLIRDIEKNRTIISTIGEPDKDLIKLNENLIELNKTINNKNNLLLLIKEKYTAANTQYIANNKELSEIEKDIIEYSSKNKILEEDTNKLYSSTQEHIKKVINIDSFCKVLFGDIKVIDADIEKLKETKLRAPTAIKQDIETLSKDIIEKKAIIASYSTILNELKIPLPSGGNCKHCRRIITADEVQSCKIAIDQEINDINVAAKTQQENISKLNSKHNSLKEELQKTENIIASIFNKKQLKQNKEQEIETKKLLQTEFNKLLDSSRDEYNKKKLLLDELVANKPKDNLENCNALKLELDKIKAKIILYTKEADILNIELQTLSNNVAILNHKIEQRILDIEKIKEHNAIIIELERNNIIHSKVIGAFGSKGIPALITQTILDDFMLETNIFLSKLRPGIQMQFILEKERSDGDLDDTLDMQFLLNNNIFEYEQLSGAQKLIVALALRLGLGSVLTKRLGTSMKMLLIDEVDQCLDDDGIELFEAAIKKLSIEMKVLVITHNKELKSKFTNAILVEQDANLVSTARVANEW
jgi:DNA repair exonuclease SbcCD ATPase subunit